MDECIGVSSLNFCGEFGGEHGPPEVHLIDTLQIEDTGTTGTTKVTSLAVTSYSMTSPSLKFFTVALSVSCLSRQSKLNETISTVITAF